MADIYSFPYMALTITVTIDGGRLTAKQGIRTFEVPLDRLRYFYVQRHGEQHRELIIAWERTPDAFKLVRLFADQGVRAPAFDRLLEALAALRPEADLRNTPEAEAYKLMRATNQAKVAMVVTPLILVAVMALIGLPWLIHGLDRGHAQATPSSLAQKLPDSRNLELEGVLDLDHSMRETTTHQGGRTTSNDFIPVVDPDWDPSQPVRVVLEAVRLSDDEADDLAERGRFPCTLRNVLWEGLSSDNREFFESHYHLTVPSDVLLCEYAPRGPIDLFIFLGMMIITVVVIGIAMVVIVVKRRRAG